MRAAVCGYRAKAVSSGFSGGSDSRVWHIEAGKFGIVSAAWLSSIRDDIAWRGGKFLAVLDDIVDPVYDRANRNRHHDNVDGTGIDESANHVVAGLPGDSINDEKGVAAEPAMANILDMFAQRFDMLLGFKHKHVRAGVANGTA